MRGAHRGWRAERRFTTDRQWRTRLATGKSLVASISEKLSLFVYRAGMKLFAARGKVEVQAQSDEMALTAEKDVKITATEGRIEINAANGILLASGGGYIRIEGGNIDVHGPGKIDIKGAQHVFGGPTQLTQALPQMPDGICVECLLKNLSSGSPIVNVS